MHFWIVATLAYCFSIILVIILDLVLCSQKLFVVSYYWFDSFKLVENLFVVAATIIEQ